MTALDPKTDSTGPAVSAGGCCGHSPSSDTPGETAATDMAECPVMVGTPVVKADAEAAGLVREHNGQRYWLCCSACAPLFDADPDRYTSAA